VYRLIWGVEDEWMVEAELVVGGVESAQRRRRSVEERRRIVEETMEAGTSVARVAQKHGVNANQVFQWRRLYRDGRLGVPSQGGMKLLPVSVAEDEMVTPALVTDSPLGLGAIHIGDSYQPRRQG